jgi:hypothetical protein
MIRSGNKDTEKINIVLNTIKKLRESKLKIIIQEIIFNYVKQSIIDTINIRSTKITENGLFISNLKFEDIKPLFDSEDCLTIKKNKREIITTETIRKNISVTIRLYYEIIYNLNYDLIYITAKNMLDYRYTELTLKPIPDLSNVEIAKGNLTLGICYIYVISYIRDLISTQYNTTELNIKNVFFIIVYVYSIFATMNTIVYDNMETGTDKDKYKEECGKRISTALDGYLKSITKEYIEKMDYEFNYIIFNIIEFYTSVKNLEKPDTVINITNGVDFTVNTIFEDTTTDTLKEELFVIRCRIFTEIYKELLEKIVPGVIDFDKDEIKPGNNLDPKIKIFVEEVLKYKNKIHESIDVAAFSRDEKVGKVA